MKLACAKWLSGCLMVTCSSTTDHKGDLIETVITQRSWSKYRAPLEGPPRQVKLEGKQRKRRDLGHTPLLGCTGGEPWGPVLWTNWSFQTEKDRVLFSSLFLEP